MQIEKLMSARGSRTDFVTHTLAIGAVALTVVMIASSVVRGQEPPLLPPPPHVGVPIPAAPHAGWFSPEGLNVLLTLVIFVGMPFVAIVMRKLGFAKGADAVEGFKKDAENLRGALISTVRGVEQVRKRTSFEVSADLAKTIEDVATRDGTDKVLAAVVDKVTAPGGVPTVAPPTKADTVVQAVRSATGRLGPLGIAGEPPTGVA